MMDLLTATTDLFSQVTASLQSISTDRYAQPQAVLLQSSIGQHLRHCIELYQELLRGYHCGVVNYEQRRRSLLLETDPQAAIAAMQALLQVLPAADKPLLLEGHYSTTSQAVLQVRSNYHRELLYNVEHLIHHMALMRIALAQWPEAVVHPQFGIAVSTIKHRETACAQ
ncbi:MAG: hypothetical protein MUF62_10730 [Chitinophagaceae bacterium]|nr:hypothetical protein [Chitinophagaceae bacterium]